MSPLNIGFFTVKDVLDKNSFSGTVHYMYRALQNKPVGLVNLGFSSFFYKRRKVLRKLTGDQKYLQFHTGSDSLYKKLVKRAENNLKRNECNVIVSPVASKEINYLKTNVPIILISDSTRKLINETYKHHSNQRIFESASQDEQQAIKKSSLIIYSSHWAAQSAISDYGANPDKIRVVPFGANLDNVPDNQVIFDRCRESQRQECKLLFIGKNWERKGGQIAFDTLLSLLEQNINASLTILGCVPPSEYRHEKVNSIPFLNKNLPQQRAKLEEIFLQSHFLIFPTRADCSPIVICEANAYGIPAIATDVGGVPTIINNSKNGYLLSLEASGKEYANVVKQNFAHPELYKTLVKTTRHQYEYCLNWDKWADQVIQIAQEVSLS